MRHEYDGTVGLGSGRDVVGMVVHRIWAVTYRFRLALGPD